MFLPTFMLVNTLAAAKNAQPPGGHIFQATGTIFELVQDIIGTNLLTMFHDDRTIIMASRVLTRKNATLLWRPYRIEINLLTKFHKDWTINVASRVKNAPPPGGHVFKATKTIFDLIQDMIGTNLLTKFHEDRKINVASRVLTRKNAPPPGGHVFQPTGIIFELVQDIFNEDRTINMAPIPYIAIYGKMPPLGSHVFQANATIFELIHDIIKTNLLTKFHEDRTINVASRVLTRKNAPPPGGHVLKQPKPFSNSSKISFHEDRKIKSVNKEKCPPPGGHVFQPTGIIFKAVQDIIQINLLTMFHEDRTINVASRVENAPPLGSHVFQAYVTIFELIRDIIDTNLLTKFHEDKDNKCGL
ncbi:hypothetical protein DPMN_090574 [Dreissena polymorpha]|uniref:Uncharacterized protein n=1 Tax=Dreissena polymorpha TaxID=45954 RepID=A0A9D4KYG2_DREPO|nr:hypothetical protein DPMN_090574 [Dreissena polymorpha]